ncbi:MAG TPA: ribonuclease D, partial [Alphaproteobacteria bacterium]|nr:ribonuclease D [Alphaproteobacteria bacterium]
KDLVKEVLEIDLSKQAQCSDWSGGLTDKQLEYAASDVFYLHKLKERLYKMLEAENRTALAKKCFCFIESRVELDILGWQNEDIFAH